jgi:predicted transglutaminase-like cysteine proteinase
MTSSLFRAALVAIGLMGLGATSASAAGIGGLAHGLKNAPAVRYVVARQPTLAPFAHVVFCMKLPTECQSTGGQESVTMDARHARLLLAVNRSVNRTIRPINDQASAGNGAGDDWELSPRQGDCEDFAITKRHRLIALGWPSSALRLAVATTPWGEGHAVLVVRTDRGDLVLDNRTNSVRDFQKTGLRFVKIQSAENPRRWLAV